MQRLFEFKLSTIKSLKKVMKYVLKSSLAESCSRRVNVNAFQPACTRMLMDTWKHLSGW